jgi:hypothetical protein
MLHRGWPSLCRPQIKYAALDAFVSYALGCKAVGRALPPPVDLARPAAWALATFASYACSYQHLQAQEPDKEAHDFHGAEFQTKARRARRSAARMPPRTFVWECGSSHGFPSTLSDTHHTLIPWNVWRLQGKGHGAELFLFVKMARFKTRLRRTFFVDVELKDGRVMQGRCVWAKGKSARVEWLKWSKRSGGGRVLPADVSSADVFSIDMSDPTDSPDEAKTRSLISQVRRRATL